MVKVLHVIDSLSGSGGAEHGLVREITRFSSATEQLVVRLFSADTLEPELVSHGIPVVSLGLNSGGAGWNWPLAASRLRPVISDFDPDVMHSSLFAANMVAQLAARRSRLPVLSTFTLSGDPGLLRRYQPGASSWKGSTLRSIAGHLARSSSARFRALTRDALETNCRLLGVSPSTAEVIPRGVPIVPRDYPARTRAELGLPADVPILINVGRQTAQKGHPDLVRVLEGVRHSFPAHLVILGRSGDGSEALCRAIDEAGLSDHVSLVEFTPDVVDYLMAADVFVFSSHMEGLGTAVLEAMAAGIPVVAFDIPPVREATDDGRLATLVPAGDVPSLVAATAEVLEGSVDMSAAARAWVEENRSVGSVATQVENLLVRVGATGNDSR